uniref:SH3 domain containing GRB2 like 1, endophilin A2 n=1 Tax=Eptatretus burgeri TaxID=7764 RepID=A0A8C4QID4_EPTBU
MSVAGLKKQFHKASQFVSEKVGGAEGTKLDDEFLDMERKVDITNKAVMDMVVKTQEYLQPNPASRAKLGMLNTMSKIRGQVKSTGYPQPEGLLGESMIRHGRDLGEDTNFGLALVEVGEALRQLAEVKDALDIGVKQNFIDPLQSLQDKELKEIGVEQVSQLVALVEAQVEFHQQAASVFEGLQQKLQERLEEASSRPRREFNPKRVFSELELPDSGSQNGGISGGVCNTAVLSAKSPAPPALDQPSCRAQFDFEPENEGELAFREGDVITLTNQIDENWFEGMVHGHSGFFPINYVEVLVPLPQ